MQSRIEHSSRLENTEHGMNEFAHHGPDNGLGRLTGDGEAFAEALSPGDFIDGGHAPTASRVDSR